MYIWKRPERQSASPSQLGAGRRMDISEDFQLRARLGEGVVPGIKPTPQPAQRPGKKCSREESLSRQARALGLGLSYKTVKIGLCCYRNHANLESVPS